MLRNDKTNHEKGLCFLPLLTNLHFVDGNRNQTNQTCCDEQPNGDPEEGVVSTRCVGGGGQQQRERAQMRRHSTHQHFLLARRSVEVLVNTLELLSLQERQAH